MFEHFSQRTWSILTIFKQPTFSLFLPDCCQFDPTISANLGWQWLLLAQRPRRARAGSVRLGLYGFKIFGLQDVVVDVLSRLRGTQGPQGPQGPRVAGSPRVSHGFWGATNKMLEVFGFWGPDSGDHGMMLLRGWVWKIIGDPFSTASFLDGKNFALWDLSLNFTISIPRYSACTSVRIISKCLMIALRNCNEYSTPFVHLWFLSPAFPIHIFPFQKTPMFQWTRWCPKTWTPTWTARWAQWRILEDPAWTKKPCGCSSPSLPCSRCVLSRCVRFVMVFFLSLKSILVVA